ncbi:hypothetical protein BV22DRAFT_1123345 [Leucogyrophana mollusca]|uniref:Uncharacterized protein n=1 Tax=Leucogyrophana mollusca TaxID=85980 RepID=A0ACB8B0Q6_9AGAM|nr:hypothetical protein BV22DRAFT_1123345 [Leucogyrophana mollusca]
MAQRREALFPATSIGRVQGANIVRSASRESLSAHPLLSPGPSSSSSPNPDQHHREASSSTPRYVPYTPRQRVVTTSATTGTTAQPSVSVAPQQPQGGATSKLQLTNLKAAAQGIGLDTGSLGWAMLEKLTYEGDASDEWSEIWIAITKGKASLLLPLEPSTTQEKITADFVQDHIVFCDGSTRSDAPVVTMSGLRGQLVNETLTFRSALSPTGKHFQDLIASSASRSSLLAALPPLPTCSPHSPYPKFSVPAYSPSLPLPPRPSAKPPLPPRPAARPTPAQSSSRLSMPFASLFGQKPATPPNATVPLPPPTEAEHIVEVSAFSIDRHICRKDVGRDIVSALKSEIQDSLNDVPPAICERVQNFAAWLHPLVKSPKKKLHDIGGSPSKTPYIINAILESPEEIADKFQEFYAALEHELQASDSPISSRRREDPFVEGEHENERREREKAENDTRVHEILETVERTLCTLFYDRLFLPLNSDDASHDEALSSRIAALNMLDLGLEHLDVDVGKAGPDVDVVVQACGATLSQLDVACRSPGDKAAVLVSAHKLVVDGLSKLPPIHLKTSDEQDHMKDQSPAGSVAPIDIPMVTSPDDIISSPLPIPVLLAPDEPSHPASPEKLAPRSRSRSPFLTATSPPESTTPVSGDVLLPLIIFAVVKANPAHLVSHLLFTQRYRNQTFGGEESYCLINLMAVAEFLENVDLGALGLGDSEKKVISTADLTPIPIVRTGLTPDSPNIPLEGTSGSLRGRVEQQVDAIAGSANKVISGVVDSSFGVLRSLLPGHPAENATVRVGSVESTESAPWNMRPGLGLLRRESGFSIASLAASLPGQREKAKSSSHPEEVGQQLVTVSSRPSSVKSLYVNDDGEDGAYMSEKTEDDEDDEDGEDEGEEDEEEEEEVEGTHDTRSIRSFESMMSGKARKRKQKQTGRKSLTDRLAAVPGLSRLSQSDTHKMSYSQTSPPIHKTSLLLPATQPNRFDTPGSSRAQSPISLRLPPPNRRFVECAEDDIKVSEVGELLREYKRLVEGIRAMGGFDE